MRIRRALFLLFLFLASPVLALPDHYGVLGVSKNARGPVIDEAYRRHLLEHPQGIPAGIRDAYLTLSDPERRAAYDQACDRQSLVRNFAYWHHQVRVQLRADYDLRHSDPARVRAGMLRMLQEEADAAWARMFPARSSTPEPDRAAQFWNFYRQSPLERYPHVLSLARDEARGFLAARPTLEEVLRFMDLIDPRRYLWRAASESKHGCRYPDEEEGGLAQLAKEALQWAIENDRAEDLAAAIGALSRWWNICSWSSAEDRHGLVLARGIERAAERFATTADAVWTALAKDFAAEDGLLVGLEAHLPALATVVTPDVLYRAVQQNVALTLPRYPTQDRWGVAAKPYGAGIRALVERDRRIAQELADARGRWGWVAALRSTAAACKRALAQAAALAEKAGTEP